METKIFCIEEAQLNSTQADEIFTMAGQIIENGGLVAFPTETVYGLGGDALNPDASKAIYAAKGRPSDNPLIVHIAEFEKIYEISDDVPEVARLLADRFWPGPLTMIVRKNESVPFATTGGLDTVAVRLPSDPIAREFIKKSGGFIAAPSANTSGRPSPTTAAHVAEDLSGRIDMIIDGGRACIGLESTIVDLSEEVPVILRPGYVTIEMLREICPDVVMDKGLALDATQAPKAPGMKYRHYAPKADMTLVRGETMPEITAKIKTLVENGISGGYRVGVIATEETADKFDLGEVLVMGTLGDENTLAAGLYDVLRRFDDIDVDMIYAPCFSKSGIGEALYNRMLKAAGRKVIE